LISKASGFSMQRNAKTGQNEQAGRTICFLACTDFTKNVDAPLSLIDKPRHRGLHPCPAFSIGNDTNSFFDKARQPKILLYRHRVRIPPAACLKDYRNKTSSAFERRLLFLACFSPDCAI